MEPRYHPAGVSLQVSQSSLNEVGWLLVKTIREHTVSPGIEKSEVIHDSGVNTPASETCRGHPEPPLKTTIIEKSRNETPYAINMGNEVPGEYLVWNGNEVQDSDAGI